MIKISKSLKNKDNVVFIKYRWDISFIILSTSKKILPKYLRSVIKECNYTEDLYPYYKIVCEIEDIYHKLIDENKNDIICNIKLTKCIWCSSSVKESNIYSTKSDYEEIVMNESFIPFFNGLRLDIIKDDEGNVKNDNESSDPSTNNLTDISHHTVEIDLIHLGSEELNKKIYNIVCKDATPSDVLTYLLGPDNVGIKSAIIDPLDNQNTYPYIIIPPRNLRNSIKFLQTMWGMYSDEVIAFIDLGFMYILKQGLLNHEIEEGDSESTRIFLKSKEEFSSLANSAFIEDDLNNFYYMPISTLNTKDIQLQLGEIIPDQIAVSNYDLALNLVDVEKKMGQPVYNVKSPIFNIKKPQNIHTQSKKKIAFQYDATNNLFNVASKMRQYSRKNVIPISVGGADLESFKPNKKIILKVLMDRIDKKYDGEYNILNSSFLFKPVKGIEDSFLTTCYANINISNSVI